MYLRITGRIKFLGLGAIVQAYLASGKLQKSLERLVVIHIDQSSSVLHHLKRLYPTIVNLTHRMPLLLISCYDLYLISLYGVRFGA